MWFNFVSAVGILCSLSDDWNYKVEQQYILFGVWKGGGSPGSRIVFVTLFNILYGAVPDAYSNRRSMLHIFRGCFIFH